MAPNVALQLLNNAFVLLARWPSSLHAAVGAAAGRASAVNGLGHRKQGVFHALLNQIGRPDRDLFNLKELLFGRARVLWLVLSRSFGVEFLLQVLNLEVHDDLNRGADVVQNSEARHLLEPRFLLFQ